jgi:hypothetical protein
MSSVLSGYSQIPRSSSGFICVLLGDVNEGRFFSEAQFATAIATGSTVSGTNVYFATNALAIAAMVTPSGDTSSPLRAGQTFKDLGKNYVLYVPSDTAGGVQQIWCVFTKVRRIGAAADSTDWEGDNGSVGYICTFSAGQTNVDGALTTSEPRCLVARTGFGHGF